MLIFLLILTLVFAPFTAHADLQTSTIATGLHDAPSRGKGSSNIAYGSTNINAFICVDERGAKLPPTVNMEQIKSQISKSINNFVGKTIITNDVKYILNCNIPVDTKKILQ